MRTKLVRVTAAWLAVFAAFAGFALQTAPAAHADTGADEALFLTLTNSLRASHGLGALATESQLTSIARSWSAQMAAAGGISHNLSLQSEVTSPWTELGENVGTGPAVDTIQTAFIASPHHYENLVNPDYNYVGIGVAYGSGGAIYVTVDFMDLAHASVSAPAPTAPRTTTRATAPRTTAAAVPRAAAPATAPPAVTTPTTLPPPPVPSTANPSDAFAQVLSELRDLDQ